MNNNQPFQTKRTKELYTRFTTVSNIVWKIAESYERATLQRISVDVTEIRLEKQRLRLEMSKLLNICGEIESTIEDLQ